MLFEKKYIIKDNYMIKLIQLQKVVKQWEKTYPFTSMIGTNKTNIYVSILFHLFIDLLNPRHGIQEDKRRNI